MSTISLKAVKDSYCQLFPREALKHCTYIVELVGAADDSDSVIEIPDADEIIIKFMCAFLEQHKDDPEVPPDWAQKPPVGLTDWDRANLAPIVGIKLIDLMKSADFLVCRLMLNAVASYVGKILVDKSEKEIQEYFGIPATFTEAQAEEVKKKYPLPFY